MYARMNIIGECEALLRIVYEIKIKLVELVALPYEPNSHRP